MKRLISTLALAFASVGAFAQAQVGSIAQDFTLTDINGQTQHLYSYLDSGYTVIIDVSAAWCGPCWAAHTSGVFENLTNHYGTNGSITPGKIKVIFIEGESQNTTAQLYGPKNTSSSYATNTQGDWVTGTNYPIIDNTSQNSFYLYGGFPSFTVICRDRLVAYKNAGYGSSMGAESFWLQYANTCPTTGPSTGTDAKAVPYSGTNYYICNTGITPTLKFQNYSKTATITSANIELYSGSTKLATQPWTGSLAPYAVASVPFTATVPTSAPFGPYKYKVVVSGDAQTSNDMSKDSLFKVFGAASATTLPFGENFEGVASIPYRYGVTSLTFIPYNSSTGALYTVPGRDGSTTEAALVDFADMTAGSTTELVLGSFNTSGNTNITMGFDLAYAPKASESDKLEVLVSTDCGQNWAAPYSKAGTTLATTASTGQVFIPTAAGNWRHEMVNLAPYKGSNMIVKFKGTSAAGSYAWLDNIRIVPTLDVTNVINSNSVNLYPNPAKDAANLDFTLAKSGTVVVNVLDATGRTVANVANGTMAQGAQHMSIPTATLAAGVYSISIQTEEGTLTQRLSVVK